MANLENLKADLRSLSLEDLNELMKERRTGRRTVKQQTVERAKKAAKQGIITKSSVNNVLSGVSPEQAAALLKQLQGG